MNNVQDVGMTIKSTVPHSVTERILFFARNKMDCIETCREQNWSELSENNSKEGVAVKISPLFGTAPSALSGTLFTDILR